MKYETPESQRKERLAQLLAKNKTRLARNALIERYQQELGYHLTGDEFINLDVSNHIKHEVYRKESSLQKQKITAFVDFQNVLVALNQLRQGIVIPDETWVICYYLDKDYRKGVETGGIKIKFKDFWSILEKIGNEPGSDIVAVDEHLAFGICVQVGVIIGNKDYDYILTTWGLGDADN
jgi:hypothetical protein